MTVEKQQQPTETHVVVAKFDGNYRSYNFLCDMGDITIGDKVVVDTQHGIQIATVAGFKELKESEVNATKWVVQRIDVTAHEARLERIKKEKADAKKRKELKAKMDKLVEERVKITMYEQLIEDVPELKELLDEYKSL